MALDGGRYRIVDEAMAGTRALTERLVARWAVWWPVAQSIGLRGRRFLSNLPIVRWFSRSLARRIVFSNAVGLFILLVGYMYMNQYKDWLVDAKVDSLTAQGEIIAQAIAGSATPDGERPIVDPDSVPELGLPPPASRDDGFAELSYSIGPEKVAPILRKLIQPDIRARVYDRDGRLVVDSDDFLSKRKLGDPS